MSTTLDTAAKVKALYGGTWQAWGKGRVPVGVDPNDADFSAPNLTGGSKTVTLTIDQMPSHHHAQRNRGLGSDIAASGNAVGNEFLGTSNNSLGNTHDTGGSQAHENMPPYQTLYYWLRTA